MAAEDESDREDASVEASRQTVYARQGSVGPRTRHRTPDKAKFDKEVIEGKDWSHSLERFVDKRRIIDKTEDNYEEFVEDPVTGEVLRDVRERLTKHRNRGSAKKDDESQ